MWGRSTQKEKEALQEHLTLSGSGVSLCYRRLCVNTAPIHAWTLLQLQLGQAGSKPSSPKGKHGAGPTGAAEPLSKERINTSRLWKAGNDFLLLHLTVFFSIQEKEIKNHPSTTFFIKIVFTCESPALLLEAEGGFQSCLCFFIGFCKVVPNFYIYLFLHIKWMLFLPKMLTLIKSLLTKVSALKGEIKRPPCASKPLSNSCNFAPKLKAMCISLIIY